MAALLVMAVGISCTSGRSAMASAGEGAAPLPPAAARGPADPDPAATATGAGDKGAARPVFRVSLAKGEATHDAAVTLREFDRDLTVFDSDMMNGNDAAAVPLSGTGRAPDGTVIQARAVSVDDGGKTTTGWQDIATISGGIWSGVLQVPRSASWYRAEARIRESSAPPARTANRFGSGLIVFFSEQSMMQRLFLKSDLAPETIGKDAGRDIQVWQLDDRGKVAEAETDATLAGPWFITDARPYTPALAAFAAVLHKTAPGLKVMALFDVKSGSGPFDPLRDSRSRRIWDSVQKLLSRGPHAGTGPMSDGQTLGAFVMSHRNGVDDRFREFALAVTLGIRPDGTRRPGIDTSRGFTATLGDMPRDPVINHVYAEAMPGILTGRTRLILADPGEAWASKGGAKGKRKGIDYEAMRADRAWLAATYPDHFIDAPEYPITKRFDLGKDQVHFDRGDQYGGPNYARSLAGKVLNAAGIVPFEAPRFDRIRWTPDHVELWSSAGPVTTIHRQEAKQAGIAPGRTGNFEGLGRAVLGFQWPGYAEVTRVEIVDAEGNPAHEGRIRVYPESGRFDGNARLWYGRGSAGTTYWDRAASEAHYMKHFPVVDMGLEGDIIEHGWWVNPGTDIDFINRANDL